MALPDVYPDAETMCIHRSIHGVRPALGLRRQSSGLLSGQTDQALLRRRRAAVDRKDSTWGRVGSIAKATHFVVDMVESKKTSWVASNMKKKECVRYVADLKNPNHCCCGRQPRQHCEDAALDSRATSGRSAWDRDLDTREYPSDANGRLYFRQSDASLKPAKYARVSDNTDPKMILKLLTDYWRLSIPQLVISVSGGAKNFKLNSQDQATFNRGLVKAMRTISVWVTSGGTNVGATRVIGNAIREAHSMSRISKEEFPKVALIGIPPWAYTAGTDRLINEENEEVRSVTYKVDPVEKRGQPCPLNPDHTHFILVDDGRRNKYGGNLLMCAKLQEYIQKPPSEGGLGVPVVTVTLEGGVDSINTTLQCIQRSTPVILCNGTGRAADLLSYATRHTEMRGGVRCLRESCLPVLREKIHALLDIARDDPELDEVLATIDRCMVDEHLLTVFEMQKGEHVDLDLAILTALLKLQAVTPISQLSLALSWNRADVAESKIFTDDFSLPPHTLHPFITEALVSDRVEFLRLFIERGVIVKDYLTVARLRRLYNSAPIDSFLRTLLDDVLGRKPGQPIFLHDIGILIKYLTGAHHEPLYMNDKHYRKTNQQTRALIVLSTCLTGMNMLHCAQEEYVTSGRHRRAAIGTGDTRLSLVELTNPGMHFDYPFRELFLWAVLMDKPELGEFLWEHVTDPVSSAVAASSMLTSMAEAVNRLSFASQDYMDHARKYEQLAIGVIEECHATNDDLAQQLISIQQFRWGKPVIEMAGETNDMDFISHRCCQSLINDIWHGGLVKRDLSIIFTLIFPFLVPLVIGFKDEESIRAAPFPLINKFIVYFKAPVTTFYRFLISFAGFLIFYSAFILFFLRPEPSLIEYLLFVWIVTIMIEEIREAVASSNGHTVKLRVRRWFSSNWNKFDIILVGIAVVAFGIHWIPSAYDACRALYAVDCMLFYVRTLRFFAASTRLGPKMVMIWKMMSELLVFLCILAVFLVGYGVASQALLYPNQEFAWFSLKNILVIPYFQIYGELYLEAIQNGEMDGCGTDGGDPCPTQNMMVLLLLAVYLLIGNVLLLNLLIAIFTRVFEEVQTNSLVVWRYENYFLVMEFKDKPWLPPPFIIIVHLYQVVVWLVRQCVRSCSENSRGKDEEKAKEREHSLHLFERECAAQYRRKRAAEEDEDLSQRVARVEDKLNELGEIMKTMEQERKPIKASQWDLMAMPSPISQGPACGVVPGDIGNGRGKMAQCVARMNAINSSYHQPPTSHHQPTSILKKRTVPPPPQMALALRPSADVPLHPEESLVGHKHPCSPGSSPSPNQSPSPGLGGAAVWEYGGGPDGNVVLEHTIVESPFVSEAEGPAVRSPPEGGDVPHDSSSNSQTRSSSRKKRRRKKKVAPQEISASPRGWVSSPQVQSGSSDASTRSAERHGASPWYHGTAFPTIREQDEEMEEQEKQE